ncbi:MAG: extracellular solute-binding protein [Ruminococcaceae bacterium]|nr:extracellular solute-binding protein [Oscillospiraceae bacterium]
MKKTSLARLLALLLVVITVVSSLAACGGKKNPAGAQSENGEWFITNHNEENPNIEGQDYDGYEFTFICQPYLDGTGAYSVNYLVSDGETGNHILDAVYRRNSDLTRKYNVTFNQMKVKDLITTVRSQVMGGSTEFDAIIGTAKDLATLARENLLLDLNSVDRFDMTKSYWDGNAANDLKIGNKLYFTNCDLNVQELAFVVYFNKQLIKDKELKSPYEYMEEGQWTIDNWSNLVQSISDDVNGDGSMTETDRYGTIYEFHNGRMFLYGSGVRATTNDATGKPVVTLFETNKAVNVIEKCKDVFASSSSWCINDMSGESHGYPDKWDYMRSLFCQDLYLFHYEGTNIIHQFADMESEFGIVPFPKYDENQEKYTSMYPLYCAMFAMPNTLEGEELERAANIIEDMNYLSSLDLKGCWYDKLLKRRYTQDTESEANLELIKNGRVYDVGLYYDFGGLRLKLIDLDVRSQSLNTNYKRIQKAIEADIKSTYSKFDLS